MVIWNRKRSVVPILGKIRTYRPSPSFSTKIHAMCGTVRWGFRASEDVSNHERILSGPCIASEAMSHGDSSNKLIEANQAAGH